jgi:Hint module
MTISSAGNASVPYNQGHIFFRNSSNLYYILVWSGRIKNTVSNTRSPKKLQPTTQPSAAPVARPVARPVAIPVAIPVAAPVQAPAPKPVSVPSRQPCFSGHNYVEIQGIGMISINQVKIGDYVRVGKTNQNSFSQVYSFGHFDHDMEAEFIQLYTTTGNASHSKDYTEIRDDMDPHSPLEISWNHLLFVKRNGYDVAIPASEVVVGDEIGIDTKIESIQYVKRRGVYTPMTFTGDIIVSGIRASSHVKIITSNMLFWNQHILGQIATYPHRLFCRYFLDRCVTETYTTDGYSMWAFWIIQLGSIMNEVGSSVAFIASLLLAPLVATTFMIENGYGYLLIVVVCVAGIVAKRRASQKKLNH